MNDETPVIVIFNLARIGFSIDGKMFRITHEFFIFVSSACNHWLSCTGDAQIHNSYNATRVLFNPDIKEVKDYIKRCLEIFTLVMHQVTHFSDAHMVYFCSGIK